MSQHIGSTGKSFYAALALVLSLGSTTAAMADSPVFGGDPIRVRSGQPGGSLDAGPSGGGFDGSCDDTGSVGDIAGTGGAGGRVKEQPHTYSPSVDYCVDLAPTDESGPYRAFFHLSTGEHGAAGLKAAPPAKLLRHTMRPHTGGPAYLSFEITTRTEVVLGTSGGDGFLGALYDDTDTLVASDTDAADRMSLTLEPGTYTLAVTADGLTGRYLGQVSAGTCSGN